MDIHLFATDESAILLAKQLPADDRVTALLVPENRLDTGKVARLIERSPWPHFIHARKAGVPRDLPPAQAGLSWLYSQIIAADDLRRYPSGILNMHGGKIPEYRGASVLVWAMINGEDELGITWHEMSEEVDAGPIWYESTIPIPSDATVVDMREAMIEAGLTSFSEAWRRFRQRHPPPRHPDLAKGRVWPMRRPSDGALRPGLSQAEVRNFVRALSRPGLMAVFSANGGEVVVRDVLATPRPGAIPYRCADGSEIYLVPAGQ